MAHPSECPVTPVCPKTFIDKQPRRLKPPAHGRISGIPLTLSYTIIASSAIPYTLIAADIPQQESTNTRYVGLLAVEVRYVTSSHPGDKESSTRSTYRSSLLLLDVDPLPGNKEKIQLQYCLGGCWTLY